VGIALVCYNQGMSEIPEELQKRWAAKDRDHKSEYAPEIATITLDDYEPSLPPVLDELPDSSVFSPLDDPPCFHAVEASSFRPLPETIKLHKEISVGLGTISIANYAPSKLPKTRNH